jgi:hypothetical protein
VEPTRLPEFNRASEEGRRASLEASRPPSPRGALEQAGDEWVELWRRRKWWIAAAGILVLEVLVVSRLGVMRF